MNEYVHWNVDDLRKAHAATVSQMRAKMSSGPIRGRDVVDYQELSLALLDRMLEVTVVCFEARNNGLNERIIAQALGTALGNHAGSYMKQAVDQGVMPGAMILQAAMSEATHLQLTDGKDGGAIFGESIVHPMQGSRA